MVEETQAETGHKPAIVEQAVETGRKPAMKELT